MIRKLEFQGKEIHLSDLKEASKSRSIPLQFDVRYARTDNFLSRKVYPSEDAFLLSHVAEDLFRVHQELNTHGFGLLIFDGYRPWSVTKLFWDSSNDQVRQFLADPARGSTHNRGCAVDLSLYDLKTGKAVPMPSDFDEMNEKAYADYQGGDEAARKHRDLLISTMERHHFKVLKNEWWHFNHESQTDWPLLDFKFEEILQAPKIPHPLPLK